MKTLQVALGDRSYPIWIGQGTMHQTELWQKALAKGRVAIVTNDIVGPLYAAKVAAAIRETGREVIQITLPDGEQHKDWQHLNQIFDQLMAHRFERGETLVALGGGVIGDMAGFAAACYQRGMRFVQIPTTLLSQVDSSVGGKTAINHPQGKNMIGAFYQPAAVLIDIDMLDTLPDREMSAGLAEVIKYGCIMDQDFFTWLETNIDVLRARDPDALLTAISIFIASMMIKTSPALTCWPSWVSIFHTVPVTGEAMAWLPSGKSNSLCASASSRSDSLANSICPLILQRSRSASKAACCRVLKSWIAAWFCCRNR